MVQTTNIPHSSEELARLAQEAVSAYVQAGGKRRGMTNAELQELLLAQLDPSRSNYRSWMSPISLWAPRGSENKLIVYNGIFPPSTIYTAKLIEEGRKQICQRLETSPEVNLLDLACGCGIVGLDMAERFGLAIDCVDIKKLAISNTRINAQLRGIAHLINAWQSDGLKNVHGLYDFIFFQAPIAVKTTVHGNDINATDVDGKLLRSVFDHLPKRLHDGGMLLLMSHEDISPWMPAHLKSDTLSPFMALGMPLAIHSVKVR